jgi:hypothetical protein
LANWSSSSSHNDFQSISILARYVAIKALLTPPSVNDVRPGGIDSHDTAAAQKPSNALAVVPGSRRKRMKPKYILSRPAQPICFGAPFVGEDQPGIDNSLPPNRIKIARRPHGLKANVDAEMTEDSVCHVANKIACYTLTVRATRIFELCWVGGLDQKVRDLHRPREKRPTLLPQMDARLLGGAGPAFPAWGFVYKL